MDGLISMRLLISVFIYHQRIRDAVSLEKETGFNKQAIQCETKEHESVSQNHFERGFNK